MAGTDRFPTPLLDCPIFRSVESIGQLAHSLSDRTQHMSRLYVGNLSWDTTQDSLRNACAAGGRTVKEVTIMTDRETGRPRGFAFVEMGSKGDADAAIKALDGSNLDGRQIKVNEAQERAPRAPGGGGGGGGNRW